MSITDERLREMANGATIYGHERNAIAAELLAARAEVERLRSRVGWLDHLDTPEGRAMQATEAVRVENEQLRDDLREAMELLRAYGQPHYWVGLKEAIGWNASYRKLMEKHKETP